MQGPNATDDIFAILGIEAREDAYSSLLVRLLQRSRGLRQLLLAHAFGDDPPSHEDASVLFRREPSPDEGIVDILVLPGPGGTGGWAMFIESKLYSGEHGEQTQRYWNACRKVVGATGRMGGIFLTIEGQDAECKDVVSLTHERLVGWIEEHIADFDDHMVLKMAAEAYVRRARPPSVDATLLTKAVDLIMKPWGLLPRFKGVDAMGVALCDTHPGGWTYEAFMIQGKAHANPGLRFWQEGWWDSGTYGPTWTAKNYNVHLEMELWADAPWCIKLHFESEPYYTQKVLRGLPGYDEFASAREVFRRVLHASIENLTRWKRTNYVLQVAILETEIGSDATVGQLCDRIRPALSEIAPHINNALRVAKQAVPQASAKK